MSLIKYRHIIGRENNVVRVDFARHSDPPAPKFPGANGLRPVKEEEWEAQCMLDDRIGIPVLPPRARNSSEPLKISAA
jgi:hypothetical protein